jgi:hypothetical protein
MTLVNTNHDAPLTPRTAWSELPEFLSPDQLLCYLGIGRSSAYDFARRNGIRIGRLLRVPKSILRREI